MFDEPSLQDRLRRHKWIILIIWMCLAVMSRFLKVGFMIGANEARFTGMSIVFPIVGYLFTFPLAFFSAGCAWALAHLIVPIPMTMGVPTFFAILSWVVSKREKKMQFLFHVGVPALCILLFCNISPRAWPYASYWTVPIALHFLPSNLLFRALQSTFIAHGVGSVIWSLRIPMSCDQWVALVPLVAFERILYSLSSVFLIVCFLILNAYMKKEPFHTIHENFYKVIK